MDNTQHPVWRVSTGCCTLTSVPSRRLEDRIRELCVKALTVQDSEMDSVFSELRFALQVHAKRLRKMAGKKLTSQANGQPQERRSA
jgi:hypothetical protein